MRARTLTLAALVALLLLFGAVPVLAVVVEALRRGGVESFASMFDAPARTALLNTLLTSAGAALFAFCLGTPLGLLLFRADLPGRNFFRAVFTLPVAIPPYIWTMGFIALLAPRAGLINRLFEVGSIYGHLGIAFVLGLTSSPIVVLGVGAAAERIDSSLEEAARICGATAPRALFDVTLPLVLPSALSSAGLSFLFSAASFGVPYLLGVGANPPVSVLTTRIYSLSLLGSADDQVRALSLSTVLLVVALIVLAATSLAGARGRVRLASGKGASRRDLPLGRLRTPALVAVSVLALLLVALPLLAIVVGSFQRSFGAVLSADSLTTAHWKSAFTSTAVGPATLRSLLFAASSALVILVVATGLVELSKGRGRIARALDSLAALPYAVPGTVLAVGLLVLYGQDLRFVLADRYAFVLALGSTGLVVPVAYAAKHLALAFRGVAEASAQGDPSLAEAARTLGASPARAFLDVVLPTLLPALRAAFVLCFLLGATELTLSILLVAPGQALLGTLLFEWQSYAEPGPAAALASSVVVFVLLARLGLHRKGGRA